MVIFRQNAFHKNMSDRIILPMGGKGMVNTDMAISLQYSYCFYVYDFSRNEDNAKIISK